MLTNLYKVIKLVKLIITCFIFVALADSKLLVVCQYLKYVCSIMAVAQLTYC